MAARPEKTHPTPVGVLLILEFRILDICLIFVFTSVPLCIRSSELPSLLTPSCIYVNFYQQDVLAEEVPVRFGALSRNGKAQKASPVHCYNGKYFRAKGRRYSEISPGAMPGFFILYGEKYEHIPCKARRD
jgi:hypothetical protein